MAAPQPPMPAAAAHAVAMAAIPGNPGHPAGLPDARAGCGIFGMRKRNFGPAPAAGPIADGYYQPGLPPPLAIPGAVANPAELYGGGLANSTGTQPPTGVPFGAHPLKQPPLHGREHVATVVLRFYHYPPPALPLNAPMIPAALAGLPTRLVWQVRVLDPFAQNPQPAAWQGCVAWAPALDGTHAAWAAAAGAGAGGAAAGPAPPIARPWQHRCVVQQQPPHASGGSGWVDVGHISAAETGNGCWHSNGKCPLDALAGYPVGTDAYRAPGFVLGLLRNFVGAAGFPPLLCAAGAANALRYTVEYDPGHFCEENAYQSHVHMRLFAPAGMAYPAHAGAQPAPAVSPFHDALLHVLRLRNAPPLPFGLANLPPAAAAGLAAAVTAPLPVPPPGHDPFWRYVYYMH